MELAQSMLTGLLFILIYGFSSLFIFQFLLEISVAFEKHCNCTTSIKHNNFVESKQQRVAILTG